MLTDDRTTRKDTKEPISTIPLYLRIQTQLKVRVTAGEYPVGTFLPTEAKLCAEFGASRHTIREALRRLADQGLVERRQGAGTVVIATEAQTGYHQSFASIADLFQIAMETHFVTHHIGDFTLTPDIAERVGGVTGDTWIEVTGVRWTRPGGLPLSHIQCFVPKRFAHIVAEFPSTHGPFYQVLEDRSGEMIEEVIQEISAILMPRPVANTFGLAPEHLGLQLLRRYVTQRGTLIASFNWHRADQFTYRMKLHRRGSARDAR